MSTREKKADQFEEKLSHVAEKIADELLASDTSVDFKERISGFKSLVVFWAAKNKLTSGDDEDDPFMKMRDRLTRAEKEK